MKNADDSDSPRVLAVKRDGHVSRMDKRSFLRVAASVVGGASAGCASVAKPPDETPQQDDDPPGGAGGGNAIPPFQIGGTTYHVIKFADYNARLPTAKSRTAFVAFVNDDFYFRAVDDRGTVASNHHESRITDKATLAEMKSIVATVVKKGTAASEEQIQIASLFSKVIASASVVPVETTPPSSGKRMQGSEGRPQSSGRRFQGSAASGQVAGRRLQGAEGRLEGDSAQRSLGVLVINGQRYSDTRITETYTDGYTKVVHAGGTIVVRTDALPEIVQMQLAIPIANPNPQPSAISEKGSTTVVTPAKPPEPTRPRRGSGGGGIHYWRPN
jgi:hypothetical protein